MSANEDFVDQPEGQPLSPSTTFKASISSFAFSPSRTTRKRTRGALIDTTEPIASNDDDASSPGPSSPQKRPRLVSPQKKTGVKRPVADYSHLKGVTDYMKLEMDILFCGINPGALSGKTGHHFAHPTNQFWKALHQSGLTDRLLLPSEDSTLPDTFNYGMTNIVDRTTASAAELCKAEKVAGVPVLLRKVDQWRPRLVCFVGREIADAFEVGIGWKTKTPSSTQWDSMAEFTSLLALSKPGFRVMPYKVKHEGVPDDAAVKETLFFTVPSTSGLVTHYRLADRVQVFRLLRIVVDDLKNGRADTSAMRAISLNTYKVTL